MSILEGLITITVAIFGVLSVICSTVVLKYTPYVTVLLVVLEMVNVTTYGIGTVILWGITVYVIAWLILIINSILLYVITR